MKKRQIWIFDFGSQYTQLIARKTRELGYSTELILPKEGVRRLREGFFPKAIVLSGGPHSVFEDTFDYSPIFEIETLPVLGICYGMQLMGQFFGAAVLKGKEGEYGSVQLLSRNPRLIDMGERFTAWMSHSDHLKECPEEFELLFESENGFLAGICHKSRPLMALQFHPEVEHTEKGELLLEGFYKKIANLEKDWDSGSILQESLDIVNQVGRNENVLCAFSGGVDSLVAATLAQKILGKRLHCFFVDHGLLRPQDILHINLLKKETDLKIEVMTVKELFLNKLQGVSDPETKRKIIGATFIDVFEKKVTEYETRHGISFDYLLQGTLYPDVIESVSPHGEGGKSVTIKSHHNVGGLPERMNLKLLEPLRYLFKDEVRDLGRELDLQSEWIMRHPFPGPGIGVRVLGELTEEGIDAVAKSDQILFEELVRHELYHTTWQAFTVYLPIKTVGVKGDGRVYEAVICLRLVDSSDGMTAKWTELPHWFLSKVSNRITNEIKGVTRVVYDVTSKPPGTIEWE